MSTPENDMQHDGVLLTDDADTAQTDLVSTPEGAPLEGAAPENTDLSQTESETQVPQRRQVSAVDFVNQSGDAEESQPTAVLPEPPPRKKLEKYIYIL